MKRRTKILLLLVFTLVLGFIFLLPHGRYRGAVAAYKKQLLARGEKLSYDQLIPPRYAGTSNGAQSLRTVLSNYFVSSTLPSQFSYVSPGVAIPQSDSLSPPQMIDYDQNVRLAASLRPALSASALDFNHDYSLKLAIPLPHLTTLRQAELLAAGTALQALHNRDLPEAVADLNASVDLIRIFPREPFAVTAMVRATAARVALNALWECLQSGPLSDAQLAGLETRWNSLDLSDTEEAFLMFERAANIEGFAFARQSYLTNEMLAPSSGYGGGVLGNITRSVNRIWQRYPFYWAWRSSWSYDEELYCLQVFDAALQLARRSRAAGAFAPALNEYDLQAQAIVKLHPNAARHFRLFLAGREINERKILTGLARWETARRLAVVAIALKRYQLQHGVYPANLATLTPDILPQIPADFMDGQPLRYQLKPDGNFLLYSVGEDGKDDGGNATSLPSATTWVETRDIVWPRAATPLEVANYFSHPQTGTNASAR